MGHFENLNLEEVLTGLPPTENAAKMEFFKKDRKARDKLVSFVSNDCLGYIREKQTAKEMWESLKDVFAKKSIVNQVLLRKQIMNFIPLL